MHDKDKIAQQSHNTRCKHANMPLAIQGPEIVIFVLDPLRPGFCALGRPPPGANGRELSETAVRMMCE